MYARTRAKRKKNHDPNGYIKIWAMVGLAAIKGKTSGAWRAWQICKHLDQEGSGRVLRLELWTYFDYLGVGDRKRRRWVNQAVKLGLLMFDARGGHYYMVSLAQAAVILNCRHVGRPAAIRLDAFVKTGWRENVWSAYLATTNNRPISQAKKAKLTGVKEKHNTVINHGYQGKRGVIIHKPILQATTCKGLGIGEYQARLQVRTGRCLSDYRTFEPYREK